MTKIKLNLANPYTQKEVNAYIQAHQKANPNLGKVKDTWLDEDAHVCIEYASGDWFHYLRNAKGVIEWWK